MDAWTDYYQNRINNPLYETKFRQRYFPFLSLVEGTVKPGMNVLESGCGTGLVTKQLNIDANISCFDYSPGMLRLSEINLQKKIKRSQFDIRERLGETYDVIYSHGVLEHFQDDELKQIVENQKQKSKTMIHYVPSYKYGAGSFGDERLMTKEQWMEICDPEKIIDFNNGFDYILVWRNK